MRSEELNFDNLMKHAGLGLVEAFFLVAITWLALGLTGGHSAWAVTCACKCKNEEGKNVVLAPDFMDAKPAVVRRKAKKALRKKAVSHDAETLTESEAPMEYERVTDDVPVVDEKTVPSEIRDGIEYHSGHEQMISPAPEFKEPGYPIEGSPAPEGSPSPASPPPTAPLPH